MAQAVEVAVNTDTGELKILRSIGAVDPVPVNPKTVEGQVEGGLAQAIGSAIWEEIIIRNGIVTNPNFVDYKIPTSLDLPTTANTQSVIIPLPHKEGPFGAKGVGELTMIPVAPAIANAVYNAVGKRITDLPISREMPILRDQEGKMKRKGTGPRTGNQPGSGKPNRNRMQPTCSGNHTPTGAGHHIRGTGICPKNNDCCACSCSHFNA